MKDATESTQRIAGSSCDLELEFMLVKGHKVYNTPYANVYELAQEYATIRNPNPE
jgi:hypothetical protein